MNRRVVWTAAAAALSVACGDSLASRVTGHWAAPGIELTMYSGGGELRLPCVRPVRLWPWQRFDAEGRIRFAGAVRELFYNYDFVFSGQLHGDTLSATLTVTDENQGPVATDHLMTPDAESGLDHIGCLAGLISA